MTAVGVIRGSGLRLSLRVDGTELGLVLGVSGCSEVWDVRLGVPIAHPGGRVESFGFEGFELGQLRLRIFGSADRRARRRSFKRLRKFVPCYCHSPGLVSTVTVLISLQGSSHQVEKNGLSKERKYKVFE